MIPNYNTAYIFHSVLMRAMIAIFPYMTHYLLKLTVPKYVIIIKKQGSFRHR